MSWIDIAIIISLGVSIAYSLLKGMTREIFSLVAIFFGYLTANNYSQPASSLLQTFIPNQTVSSVVSFFIIFTSVTVITSLLGRLAKKIIKTSNALSLMDRCGGGVIGLLKGVLIISLILIPVSILPSVKKEIIYKSKIAPYLLSSSKFLSRLSYNNANPLSEKKTRRFLNNIQGTLAKQMRTMKKNIKEFQSAAAPQPRAHIPEKDKKKLNTIIDKTFSND